MSGGNGRATWAECSARGALGSKGFLLDASLRDNLVKLETQPVFPAHAATGQGWAKQRLGSLNRQVQQMGLQLGMQRDHEVALHAAGLLGPQLERVLVKVEMPQGKTDGIAQAHAGVETKEDAGLPLIPRDLVRGVCCREGLCGLHQGFHLGGAERSSALPGPLRDLRRLHGVG